LGNGNASLNAKIQKELAENKGSTIWRESGVKLANCVEQKNCAQMGIVWEEKYDEFESYDGMPERGTPLDTWQKSQLGNTHGSCLNAKIQKELAENKGSTIWRERRVKLANCVEQKRRA
jgi:Zn ribbon nucleic-acid-binding protein